MSEPQHIKEILPDVMQDIARRTELNHRRKRVLSAMQDHEINRQRRRKTKKTPARKADRPAFGALRASRHACQRGVGGLYEKG